MLFAQRSGLILVGKDSQFDLINFPLFSRNEIIGPVFIVYRQGMILILLQATAKYLGSISKPMKRRFV